MKKLHCIVIVFILFLGCTGLEPDIPEYKSHVKGGSPKAVISVASLYPGQAKLEVVIESTGNRKLTDLRLCYSEVNKQPDTTDFVVDVWEHYIPGKDTLLISLPGLKQGTRYYCSLFLANTDNSFYTRSIFFTTKMATNNHSWIRVANVPTSPFSNNYSNAFTISGRVFLLSSLEFIYQLEGGELFEYLPVSNEWVPRARYPLMHSTQNFSVVAQNKAYVGFGGEFKTHQDGSTGTYLAREWWCYDPEKDVWKRKRDIPFSFMDVLSVFSANDKIYVLTTRGFSSEDPVYVYMYNPVTDEWTWKAEFPEQKIRYSASFVLNGRPFVFTGMSTDPDNLEYHSCMWEYIIDTDTWERRADFPGGGRMCMIASDLNGIGYAGFGFRFDGILTTDWWSYDPVKDIWSRCSVKDGWEWMYPQFAFSVNGSIYIGSVSSGVWQYMGEDNE